MLAKRDIHSFYKANYKKDFYKALPKGFRTGFQRVSNGFQRVSKGFPMGFQRVSKGFLKGFKGFPKGQSNIVPNGIWSTCLTPRDGKPSETGFPKGF